MTGGRRPPRTFGELERELVDLAAAFPFEDRTADGDTIVIAPSAELDDVLADAVVAAGPLLVGGDGLPLTGPALDLDQAGTFSNVTERYAKPLSVDQLVKPMADGAPLWPPEYHFAFGWAELALLSDLQGPPKRIWVPAATWHALADLPLDPVADLPSPIPGEDPTVARGMARALGGLEVRCAPLLSHPVIGEW